MGIDMTPNPDNPNINGGATCLTTGGRCERHDCDDCVFAVFGYDRWTGVSDFECQIDGALTDKDIEACNGGNCPKFEARNCDYEDIPCDHIHFAKWYNDRKLKEMRQ